jgi:hypothetical protein
MIGSHVRSSRITIPDFQPPFALTNDKNGLCLVNERACKFNLATSDSL